MADPQQSPRFTPPELKYIAENKPFSDQEVAALDPQDRETYLNLKLLADKMSPEAKAGVGADWPTIGATAAVAAPMIPGAAIAGRTIQAGKYAGHAIGTGLMLGGSNMLLKKLGLSPEMADMLTLGMAFAGGKGAPAAAAEKEAAPTLAQKTPRVAPGSNVERGRTLDPNQATPGGNIWDRVMGGGVQPSVTSPSQLSDLERSIFGPQGGEAATFGVKPPPYPSNVDTQSNVSDLIDMLTGRNNQGVSTPKQFADPELRRSIDTLKRTVQRRPPQ